MSKKKPSITIKLGPAPARRVKYHKPTKSHRKRPIRPEFSPDEIDDYLAD